MKKTIIALALTLILAFGISVLVSFAGGSCCGSAKQTKDKTVSAVCPVMKAKIPDVEKAAGKSTYKGKTYYFCCSGCKPEFDKNPEKYVK